MSTIKGIDGTERQAYYGQGEQPWDVMKKVGFAPQFAAGNVLKYLRRPAKGLKGSDPIPSRTGTECWPHNPDDIDKAIWYFKELHQMVYDGCPVSLACVDTLMKILTPWEISYLQGRISIVISK